MSENRNSPSSLWTRDFTIITLGSVVSMFGNAMSGFALSLLVLDYTQNTLYYAIFVVMYTLPQIVMPIFSGAILDRFSRKKMIYTLDYISASIYLVVGLLLNSGWFNFAIFAILVFIVGCINSTYMVAYQSFYPLLIEKGNYSKAYSVSSVLETMSAVMIPISAWAYNLVGIGPLLIINAVCFFCAATLESQIKTEEKYVETQEETKVSDSKIKQMLIDLKEGMKYIISEKGLLAITMYFMIMSIGYGANSVLVLPYFRNTYENGEYIYMLVWGMAVVGRGLGGIIHYNRKVPAHRKFAIVMAVYIITNILEGTYLFFSIPIMMTFCFINGILGVTSYMFRISATQAYVPDEKKGRFNGTFNMTNTLGTLVGELISGALGLYFGTPYIILGVFMINLLAAIIIIYGNRKDVSKIMNIQV